MSDILRLADLGILGIESNLAKNVTMAVRGPSIPSCVPPASYQLLIKGRRDLLGAVLRGSMNLVIRDKLRD